MLLSASSWSLSSSTLDTARSSSLCLCWNRLVICSISSTDTRRRRRNSFSFQSKGVSQQKTDFRSSQPAASSEMSREMQSWRYSVAALHVNAESKLYVAMLFSHFCIIELFIRAVCVGLTNLVQFLPAHMLLQLPLARHQGTKISACEFFRWAEP